MLAVANVLSPHNFTMQMRVFYLFKNLHYVSKVNISGRHSQNAEDAETLPTLWHARSCEHHPLQELQE